MRRILVLLCLPIALFANYWQQETNYEISVSLDDSNYGLAGTVRIEYVNHSPDTLNQIFMHCWPNAYSSPRTPLAKQLERDDNLFLKLNEEKFKGSMTALNFQINQKDIPWNFVDDFGEIALLQLQKPLLPGETIIISTPFKVKIPIGVISRLGHYGDDFQITQWYPKPAVYDVNGWHPMPYLSQGEFYSEFGNYTVDITVPSNYLVAASGKMTTESMNSEKTFLQKKINRTDAVLQSYPRTENGTTYYYPERENPASANEPKTLVFELKNAHDFAWFCSKDWLVQSEKIQLQQSKKDVELFSYFLPKDMHVWRNSLKMMENGLNYYSDYVGAYPYSTCTAVDGSITAGAGMEYPSITIINNPGGKLMFEETLVHEVGHNWFYGALASNERTFPWMDEGMNSFIELKYFEEKHPDATIGDMLGDVFGIFTGNPQKKQRFYYEMAYLMSSSRNNDQSNNLNAPEYTSENYPSVIYAKTAMILRYMEGYLGRDKMTLIFQEYFKQFSGKHVYPKDFWDIAEYYAEEDLSWAYDGLFSTAKMDYGIEGASYHPRNESLEVLVKNHSSIQSPVIITAFLEGQEVETYWFDGFSGQKTLNLGKIKADYVVLDNASITLDNNRNNNHYNVFSVFGGLPPLKFHFLTGIDKGDQTEVFALPTVLYNANDGIKLGFIAYNSTLKEKNFRFLTAPNFGFGSQHITGTHQVIYSTYHDKYFRKINWYGGYRNETFAFKFGGMIEKYEAGQKFFFAKKNALSPWQHELDWRYTAVKTKVSRSPIHTNEYLTLEHEVKKASTLHPMEWRTNLQLINGDVLKAWTEVNLNWTIHKRKKQNVELRLFGGAFLSDIQDEGFIHRFRLTAHNGSGAKSATEDELIYSGMTDYLLDDYYLARHVDNQANWLTQQIGIENGGFKSGINVGLSSNWMTTANLTIPFPVKWLSAFADYGFIGGSQQTANSYTTAYDIGLQLNIVKDYFNIYFPIDYSENIANEYEARGIDTFGEKIRFRLDLGEIFELIE